MAKLKASISKVTGQSQKERGQCTCEADKAEYNENKGAWNRSGGSRGTFGQMGHSEKEKQRGVYAFIEYDRMGREDSSGWSEEEPVCGAN